MKIAINFHHKNKMPNFEDGEQMRRWWNKFNGSFRNVDIPPRKLMQLIQEGRAYTTQHKRYRKADNFLAGQHLAIDMDTGDERSSFEHLLQNEFIREYASFLHTTASHTPAAPRSRVVLTLERPIPVAAAYTELASALVWKFDSADKRCRDASRIFFGSEGCEISFLGNILNNEIADIRLALPYREHLQEQEEKRKEILKRGTIARAGEVSESSLDNLWDALLDHIVFAPHGQKYDTLLRISRTFGGYVASGYIERHHARNLLVSAISKRNIDSLAVAERAIDDALEYGQADPLYVKRHERNGTSLLVLDTPTPQRLATQPIEEVVGQPKVNKMSKLMLQAEGAKVRYGYG